MLDEVLYIFDKSDVTWQWLEVAVSVPNIPSWMVNKGWFSSLGVGWACNNFLLEKLSMLQNNALLKN